MEVTGLPAEVVVSFLEVETQEEMRRLRRPMEGHSPTVASVAGLRMGISIP